MLDGAAPALEAFDALAEDDEFVVFFEPPSLNNQAAVFPLMPSPHAQLADRLERHPDLARVLVLPAELKWEIRDKLDHANITERVLFPGLDGLSRWLARHYAPSSQSPRRSSIASSRRQRGRALTWSSRKMRRPSRCSISGRARTPISLTIAPPFPTRICFWESVST
jgi:hypothetical protein